MDDDEYDDAYTEDIRSTLRSASSSGPSEPRPAPTRRPLSPLRRARARSHSPRSPTGVWQAPTPRARSQSPQAKPKARPTDPKVKRRLEGRIEELESMLISKDKKASELAKQLADVKRRAVTDAAERSKTSTADKEAIRRECMDAATSKIAASRELDKQIILAAPRSAPRLLH